MEFTQTADEAEAILAAAHPLVAKAAREWLKRTARHNVLTIVEAMEPLEGTTYGIGGLYIRIATRGWFGESASVTVFPPARKGRRPKQIATYLTYHIIQGKPRFGRKAKLTLREMSFHIANFWNRPEVSA